MKATLLLCAGMLTLLPALPVSATPVLDAAQMVSQASINPVFIKYEGIDVPISALREAITIATEAAEAARKRPGRTTFANIVLERGISEAVEASLTSDSSGDQIDKATPLIARALHQNSAEMSHYAAIGWGLSEKRAASKIASLAKSPNFEGVHDAVIAITEGIIEEMSAETYDGADAALKKEKDFYKGWIELGS